MSTYCVVCGIEAKAFCTLCRSTYYCNVEHQRMDWPHHKANTCCVIPEELKEAMKTDIEFFIDPKDLSTRLRATKNILPARGLFEEKLRVHALDKVDLNESIKSPSPKMAQAYATVAAQLMAAKNGELWTKFIGPRFLEFRTATGMKTKVHLIKAVGIWNKIFVNQWRDQFLKLRPKSIHVSGQGEFWLRACFASLYNGKWTYFNNEYKLVHVDLMNSIFRHSCRPNCVIIHTQSHLGDQTEYATSQAEIQPGEELTITYHESASSFLPKQERERVFDLKLGFSKCQCIPCHLETNEALLCAGSKSSTLEDIKQQEQEYRVLARSMGLENDDFKMTFKFPSAALMEWVNRAEVFIERWSLPDMHWMAHSLRLWTTRVAGQAANKDIEEKSKAADRQLKWHYAAQTCKKNIAVNAQLLLPLSSTKNAEYSHLKVCYEELRKSEIDRYNDIATLDPHHELYCNVWLSNADSYLPRKMAKEMSEVDKKQQEAKESQTIRERLKKKAGLKR